MMRGCAAAVLLVSSICAGAPAWADIDPPRYDMHGLCFRTANTPDGLSDETMAGCLMRQRHAYDAIRRNWNEIPEVIQQRCDLSTRATGVLDYIALLGCLRTQMRRTPPDYGDPEP